MTEQRQHTEQAEAATIRANLLQVATAFFATPPSREFLDALRENPLSPVQVDPAWKLEALVQEYHTLFQVPAAGYVFPYESCYRGRSKDGKPGSLMGPSTIQVQELYQMAGFDVSPDAAELPDYAAVEFGMLQRFAQLEADALRNADEAAARLWANYQTALLGRHLIEWIPALCHEIQQQAREPYFQDFAAWICRLMSALATRGDTDALLSSLRATNGPSSPEQNPEGAA